MTAETSPTVAPEKPGVFYRAGNWIKEHPGKTVGGAALALIVGGGAIIGVSEGIPTSAGADETPALSAKQAGENCDNLTNSEAASNAELYRKDAFLPKTGKIEDQDDVQRVVTNWFGKDGPLASKGDFGSLAAMSAAVVTPARDGKTTVDANYNYSASFDASFNLFNAVAGGEEAAQKACESAYGTLVQVAGYAEQWVPAKAAITELRAVTDDKNNKVGMELVSSFSATPLKGIEFKFDNDSTKDLDYFNSVLVTADGRMYVKGTNQNASSHEDNLTGGGKDNADNSGQDKDKQGGHKGTFGKNKNKGESDQAGDVPESGGDEGHTPGTAPSYGPGKTPGTTSGTTPQATTPHNTIPNTTPTTSNTVPIPSSTTTTTSTTKPKIDTPIPTQPF